MIDDQTRTCEHCAKPLKRTQKRFCSRDCSTAHRQPTIKVVWVAHFARERGTTPWHRPGLNHKSVCGTKIVDQEEIMVEAGDLSAASELCAQCEELFDQESRRRLAQAYGILLGLANSRGQRLSALEQPDSEAQEATKAGSAEAMQVTSHGDGREISTSIRQEDHQDFSRAMRPAMDLTPYWINPTALEPDRITYQLLIDIEYAPDRFETMQLLAGGTIRHHERYASPPQLVGQVRLDPDQWVVEQPLGPQDGWYRVRSAVTFYQELIAHQQAQQQWDHSLIVSQFRAGKVVRARYGLEEVETGYVAWMGGCEKPDSPWPKPETRVEHMSDLAMRQTLICALDVEGLRLHFGVGPETLSDERLLVSLHRARAKSRHVPLQARVESQQWLREHRELVAAAESWDCGGMSAPS